MHRTNPLKRALSRALRDPDLSGTHERAPDGFLLAYGSAVQHGRPQRGSIVDVTPTLLYFFGLPVALDMDGFARSDLFTREFTTERPDYFYSELSIREGMRLRDEGWGVQLIPIPHPPSRVIASTELFNAAL